MSSPLTNGLTIKPLRVQVNSQYHATHNDISREQVEIDAAKKDPAAFRVLYERYYERIFRYLYQRLDDQELAFDAVSQVFLKAINNLHKYEHRGLPFASWLYRIAKSELHNMFKAQKAQRTVNIETTSLHTVFDEMEEGINEEKIELMLAVVNELPEQELALIEMRFFERRAFKEIAEILEITENNAKVKTYRILERLKKTLEAKPAFKQTDY